MSENTQTWRSLASAASRVKNYVAQKATNLPSTRDMGNGEKLSWTQWAGQKLRRNGQLDDGTNDRVALFPGWATRRYHQPPQDRRPPPDAPFDVEVFISGYASRYSGSGFNTRAGRAFLRLARGFAALPKLPEQQEQPPSDRGTPGSTQDDPRLPRQLPPFPDEMDEAEIAALEQQFRELEAGDGNPNMSLSLPPDLQQDTTAPSAYLNGSSSVSSGVASSASACLQQWHANLESRLYPFWSTALSSRTVRLSLYSCDPSPVESSSSTADSRSTRSSYQDVHSPIMVHNLYTLADGAFQFHFVVPWEALYTHPGALQIAFGERDAEVELFVLAELMPPPSPANSRASSPAYTPAPTYFPLPTASCAMPVTLDQSRVRLISDIDDTVKLSQIANGARAVFHNVFVKDLKDNIIDGMGDWYTAMWKRGVRFHYVSNSPFELLPVINEFFQLSHLPPGSIKLRSYAGRSLFNGLLSAPAARKRAGVIHVLDSFPQSRFILVGDTAEQDLDLYASIAKDRPEQILAIFVRDASTQPLIGAVDAGVKPLDDPTGAKVLERGGIPRMAPPPLPSRSSKSDPPPRSMSEGPSPAPYARYVPRRPVRTYSDTSSIASTSSSRPYSPAPASMPLTASPVMEEPAEQWPPNGFANEPPTPRSGAQTKAQQQLFELEKRRFELQMRVYRARLEIPPHIKLRVFRDPQECVEAMDILDTL